MLRWFHKGREEKNIELDMENYKELSIIWSMPYL